MLGPFRPLKSYLMQMQPLHSEVEPTEKSLSLQKSSTAQGLEITVIALSSSLLIFFLKKPPQGCTNIYTHIEMLCNGYPQPIANHITCMMHGFPIDEDSWSRSTPHWHCSGAGGISPLGSALGRTCPLACSWQPTLISCSRFPSCQKHTLHNKQEEEKDLTKKLPTWKQF